MKTIEVTIKGSTPLLEHSNQGVNPRHPITKKLKVLNAKRKKTDEDIEEILHLNWELGLYWDDSIGLYIPSVNVEAMFRNAAKSVRKGTIAKQQSAITVKPDKIPLIVPKETPKTKQGLYDDPNVAYQDVRPGKNPSTGSTIMLSRPRFDNWGLKFKVSFNESKFDLDEIVQLFTLCGTEVGLCDWRGKYGMFDIVEVK
jgi:hypothetical protein